MLCFFFFDEEPLLDPTDWNIVHTIFLFLALLVVVNENTVRARFGQFVYKDQVLLFATFSFWFSIENWSRLIVVFFCFHCLTPLELELIDLVDIFSGLSSWAAANLLPFWIFSGLSYVALAFVNLNVQSLNRRTTLLVLSMLFVASLLCFLTMIWDFLLSSLTSTSFACDRASLYYNNTRTPTAYDSVLGGSDFFDWHRSSSESTVIRFEDSYCFFLQLLNIVAFYAYLIVFLFLLIDFSGITGTTESSGMHSVSTTYIGILMRWLDHVCLVFFVGNFSLVLVSLRLAFKVFLDFNF